MSELKLPRIMGKPAYRVSSGNSSASSCVCFYSHLEELGVKVIEWTPLGMFFKRYEVLHLHWPDNVLASTSRWSAWVKMELLFLALKLVRLQGKRVVWTAHNLETHEKKYIDLEKAFWWRFVKHLDGVISPMRFILDEINQIPTFDCIPHRVLLPFGDWEGHYPTGRTRDAMCRELQLDSNKPILLWFGIIRPYKGVEHLLELFKDPRLSEVQLVVAGSCKDPALRNELLERASHCENVRMRLQYIPDSNVQELFEMANLCVFPFVAVTNTGSVRLALTFNKHSLVPDFPFAREFSEVVGSEWFTTYTPNQLTITNVLDAVKNSSMVADQSVDWGSYNWKSSAKAAVRFFADVVNRVDSNDKLDSTSEASIVGNRRTEFSKRKTT